MGRRRNCRNGHRLVDGSWLMSGPGRISSIRLVVTICLALGLSACGGTTWQAPRDQHIVRQGETLFSIAWRYGKDPRDVARWNRLGDGSLIYPGQVIRLTPPSHLLYQLPHLLVHLLWSRPLRLRLLTQQLTFSK